MKVVTRKRYSKEFKAQAVELARSGKPVPELAQELEISSGTLYRWISKAPQAPKRTSCGACAATTPSFSWRMTF
jgi:transposase-like protein